MTVALEALTEEECYLYAILSDKSGIDIAEFLWFAPENEDLCWRAWPFQWGWWRHQDPLQIDQSSRSCGKSESIKVRLFAFPFLFPNQEALITAPELNHLEPIIKKIEGQFSRTRLSRLMMKKPPTHRPFYVEFANGARILGAIPQKTGAGVKGKHPVWLEQDEASDYPENGWTELVETLNRSNPDATWRAHGVTRGIRDSFYQNSRHAMDEAALRPVSHGAEGRWTVHKIPAMARPTWTDEERQEKIQQYGSKDDPDYRRNVLGAHGDAQSPIFVMRRLMSCWLEGTLVSVKRPNSNTWERVPIETVCVGDRVKNAIGEGHVKAVTPTGSDSLVRIRLSSGETMVCSPEHPCLTGAGWVYADELQPGDSVVAHSDLQGVWRSLRDGEANSNGCPLHDLDFLLTSVFREIRWEELSGLGYGEAHIQSLRSLWCDLLQTIQDDPLLLARVCQQDIRRTPEDGSTTMRAVRDDLSALAPDSSVLQPRVLLCGAQESSTSQAGTLSSEGGARRPARGAVSSLAGAWRRLAAAVLDFSSRSARPRDRVFPPRSGSAGDETCCRSGWSVASVPGAGRRNAGSVAPGLWVDRVEILERGSEEFARVSGGSGPARLYDLTISGHPSFSVGEGEWITHNCVDDDVSSEFNADEYWHFKIKDTELEASGQSIEEMIQPPYDHKKYKTVWMGADIGFTIDPTEILIAAEYPLSAEEKALQAPGKAVPKDGASRLKIIGRVTLNRISEPDQAEAIMALIDFYHPKVFAMDSTGAGLPLFQGLQRRMKDVADVVRSKRARDAAESIKGYNFSSKVLVEIDETQELEEGLSFDEVAKEAGISRLVIEYSTDVLRTYVDEGRLWMPFDTELVGEFQGQTFCVDEETEILTQRGWLTLDEVRPGDSTLGVEDEDGKPVARWVGITDVNIFGAEDRQMLSLEGQAHSSLTTLNHRWLVQPEDQPHLEWTTSSVLAANPSAYRIPVAKTLEPTVLLENFVDCSSLKSDVTTYGGRVWCPTTASGTWLARRHGTVFYTGNSYSKNQMDGYGRRRIFSQGGFHALDAARMLALGHKQFAIEALQGKKAEKAPVVDAFIQSVHPVDPHGPEVAIW